MEDLLDFKFNRNNSSIIKVIGVGGGGCNAVNYMYQQGIKDVDFIVVNTDVQVLENSPVPNKVIIGRSLTEGLGAGADPSVGKEAAIENLGDIEVFLRDRTKMVFVTAGMGGGTGTGAAPVIAKLARDMGILTVGIITIPFMFERRPRIQKALEGLEEMEKCVDALVVISNEKLYEMYGNLTLHEAFAKADEVLSIAAKGIAEIITLPGYINVDFADVRRVMRDSGVALMGSASAEGEDRAVVAVNNALTSPLLNSNDISGAQKLLMNITYGPQELTMDELRGITDYISRFVGHDAETIIGCGKDDSLGNKVSVTIIATGFSSSDAPNFSMNDNSGVKRVSLNDNPSYRNPQQGGAPTINFGAQQQRPREVNFDNPYGGNPYQNTPPAYQPPRPGSSDGYNPNRGGNPRDEMNGGFQATTPNPYQSQPQPQPVVQPNSVESRYEALYGAKKTVPNTTAVGFDPTKTYGEAGYRGNLSMKELQDERLIDELESIPAYLRKTAKAPGPEVTRSRFSVSANQKGEMTLRDNNRFLKGEID